MSTEVCRVEFGTPGAQLCLVLRGRSYPDAAYLPDQDQIDTLIVAEAGPFQAHIPTEVGSSDLVELYQRLEMLHDRYGQRPVVHFKLDMDVLNMSIAEGKLGQLIFEIELRDMDPGADTLLRFGMGGEQASLPTWMRSIREALEWFPPKVPYVP